MYTVRVFAVDPGRTLGYAVVDSPAYLLERRLTQNEAFVKKRILETQPDEVVIEKYEVRPTNGGGAAYVDEEAVLVAERLKRFCQENGVKVVEQTPDLIAGNKFLSSGTLRMLRLWQPGSVHVNDAIRHALYRLWFVHRPQDESIMSALSMVAALFGDEPPLRPQRA